MCTLIALFQVVPGYPVLVAMNRDEFYDRPAVPPERRPGPPAVVAPRDLRAEGTWIGVSEHGLVAAVSNRFPRPPDPSARSRGLLCLESLASADATAAMMFASSAAGRDPYNPFNLLHADSRRVVCTCHEDATWAVHGTRGVNVLTNAGLNAGDPRARRVTELLAGEALSDLEDSLAVLRRVLADHADAGGRSICYHGERTGTRSQTVVAVSADGWRRNRLWYVDGAPCTAKSVEYSSLFR